MAEYINFEAEAEHIEQDEVSNLSDNESENSFIDEDTDVNFYRGFTNVENDINQVLQDSYNESLKDIDNFGEISDVMVLKKNLKLMTSNILNLIYKNLKKFYFPG